MTSREYNITLTVDVKLVDDVLHFLLGWLHAQALHDAHELFLRDLTVLVFVEHVERFT